MNKIWTLFLGLAFWGCSEVAVTGRKQLSLIPESQLQQMAIQEYQQFLSQNKVVKDGGYFFELYLVKYFNKFQTRPNFISLLKSLLINYFIIKMIMGGLNKI